MYFGAVRLYRNRRMVPYSDTLQWKTLHEFSTNPHTHIYTQSTLYTSTLLAHTHTHTASPEEKGGVMCELRAVLKGLQRHEGFFHRVQSRCRLKGAQRAQISPRLVPPNDDEQPLSTAPSENMAPRSGTFDAPPVLQCHRRQGRGPRCNNTATVAMCRGVFIGAEVLVRRVNPRQPEEKSQKCHQYTLQALQSKVCL